MACLVPADETEDPDRIVFLDAYFQMAHAAIVKGDVHSLIVPDRLPRLRDRVADVEAEGLLIRDALACDGLPFALSA